MLSKPTIAGKTFDPVSLTAFVLRGCLLDTLSSEERHQIYRMLKLKVFANSDGSLELSGAFGNINNSSEIEASRSSSSFRNTKTSDLTFCTLLISDGTTDVRFKRANAG